MCIQTWTLHFHIVCTSISTQYLWYEIVYRNNIKLRMMNAKCMSSFDTVECIGGYYVRIIKFFLISIWLHNRSVVLKWDLFCCVNKTTYNAYDAETIKFFFIKNISLCFVHDLLYIYTYCVSLTATHWIYILATQINDIVVYSDSKISSFGCKMENVGTKWAPICLRWSFFLQKYVPYERYMYTNEK